MSCLRSGHLALLYVLSLGLATAADAPRAELATPPGEAILAAITAPERPAQDRSRDAQQKPGELLAFLGIAPGQRVLDVNAGGGYFSELLASVVGPRGRVYAHNDDFFAAISAQGAAQRRIGERHPQVRRFTAEVPAMSLQEHLDGQPVDAILLVNVFHDFAFTHPQIRAQPVDVAAALAALRALLKPDGVVGVVDHVDAPPGDPATAIARHRIAPAQLKAAFAAAGFALEAQSALLANPDDDYSQPSISAGRAGQTDRMVVRFRRAS